MLPAHGIWRETLSLLDVMWLWTSQWMDALRREKRQLYNKVHYLFYNIVIIITIIIIIVIIIIAYFLTYRLTKTKVSNNIYEVWTTNDFSFWRCLLLMGHIPGITMSPCTRFPRNHTSKHTIFKLHWHARKHDWNLTTCRRKKMHEMHFKSLNLSTARLSNLW